MRALQVETSTPKRPEESSLGTDEDILAVEGPGDGHVPRNLRMCLQVCARACLRAAGRGGHAQARENRSCAGGWGGEGGG